MQEDLLLAFIVSVIAPYLATAQTEAARVHQYARQIIADYKTAGHAQLITAGGIVGFALAALDNIRESPAATLPLKLKLRTNAVSLNRSSLAASARLDQQRRETVRTNEDPIPDETAVRAALEAAKTAVKDAKSPAKPTPTPAKTRDAPPEARRQIDLTWAGAMTDVAAEYAAELPRLTEAERRSHLIRTRALAAVAYALGTDTAPPFKARLLSTTAIKP